MTTISLDLDRINAWDALHYLAATERDLAIDVAEIVHVKANLRALSPIQQAVVAWLIQRADNPDAPFSAVAQQTPLFPPVDEDEGTSD